MELKGKVALISGSSRGIGRAIAIILAEAGSDIVVNYVSNAKAAGELSKRSKLRVGEYWRSKPMFPSRSKPMP